MSQEIPDKKGSRELPPDVILSKEHLFYKMIPFETALGYLTEVAVKNKSKDPEIVVIFGNQNSGKSYFSRKLVEAVHEKNKGGPLAVYSANGVEESDLEQFETWRKDNQDARLVMIVVQSAAPSVNSGQDFRSAKYFKKFPSIILYIFDSKKEAPNPDLIEEQLARLIKERRQYSKNFSVPYITPEVYFVDNSRKEVK